MDLFLLENKLIYSSLMFLFHYFSNIQMDSFFILIHLLFYHCGDLSFNTVYPIYSFYTIYSFPYLIILDYN